LRTASLEAERVGDGAGSSASGGSFEGDEGDGSGVVHDSGLTSEFEHTRGGNPLDVDVGGESEVELILASLVVVLNHDGSGNDGGGGGSLSGQVEGGEDEDGLLTGVEESVVNTETSSGTFVVDTSVPRARTDAVAGVGISVATLSNGGEAEGEVARPSAHVRRVAAHLVHGLTADEGGRLARTSGTSRNPVAVHVADASSDVTVEVGAVDVAVIFPTNGVFCDVLAVLGDDHVGFTSRKTVEADGTRDSSTGVRGELNKAARESEGN